MILQVKVLGPGCANCENLAANVQTAAAQLGVVAAVEKVRDPSEYARYGLLYTPGLVVNEKLVSGGRVPSSAEIMTLLADAMMAEA